MKRNIIEMSMFALLVSWAIYGNPHSQSIPEPLQISSAMAAPVKSNTPTTKDTPVVPKVAEQPKSTKSGVVENAANTTDEPATSSATELVIGLQKTINDWRSLGWIAGIIALLQLIMKLLKFGPVDEWFTISRKKWLKPYIAAALGAILGGFTAYTTGANILNSIFAGLLMGVSSVGWNEIVNKIWQPKKREA